jgi:drug/metabolite transporter (DMT)-like permease
LRVMPPLTPICITAGRFCYAACIFVPLYLIATGGRTIGQLADPSLLAALLVTGFFVYFLSALTWYGAISRLSLSWTTALVIPGVPLLSIVFAVAFLGEHPTMHEIIGVVIAISGVVMLVTGADPHRKVGGVIEAAEAAHQPIS